MDNEKNILLRFTADSGGLDEANQRISELRDKNRELFAEYDKQVAQKQKAAGTTAKEAASMKEYNEQLKKTTSEIKSNEKSIERLEKSMKKIPEAIPQKAIEKSFRQMKREIEEQIKALRLMGKAGTEEYQRLVNEAGKLADIEGDVSREIKGIASDTAGFDLIMEGTQGIAAGFQIAQGAAALFGVEEEKLMDMMVRLQAIMAVTTGLQQIQNTVQKESHVMRAVSNFQLKAAAKAEAEHARAIAIKTGAEKGSVIALGKATVAQKAFNLVAKANPYVILATALISVVGAVALLTRANKAHNVAAKTRNEIEKESIKIYSEQSTELHLMKSRIRDANTSYKEKQKILKTVNEKYLDSKHQLKSVNDLEQWLINKTPEVLKAYALRAQAQVAMQKITEIQIKKQEDNLKSESDYLKNWTGFWLKLDRLTGIRGAQERIDSFVSGQKANAAFQSDLMIQNLTNIYNEAINGAVDLSHELGLISDDTIKDAGKSAEQFAGLVKKNEEELQNTLLSLIEEGKEKEIKTIQLNYARRIDAINKSADKEGKLRKALIAAREKEIAKVEKKYADEAILRAKELELLKAQNAAADLPKSIALKKMILEKQAELEITGIKQSEKNEELRAEKIRAVRLKLKGDLEKIDKEIASKNIDYAADIRSEELRAEKLKNERILATDKSTIAERERARKRLKNFELEMIHLELNALENKHAKGLIEEREYLLERERLLNDSKEREIEIAREAMEQKKELQMATLNFARDFGSTLISINSDRLQRELEDLEHYYTTDEKEAQKNKDKKLIKEKQFAAKKLEIKRKQAQAEKREAMFNIALGTAQAIMNALQTKPFMPMGLAMAAMATALGATQLATVASKPLPRYWKGLKGNKSGQLGWVGEYGPELMYIPKNASIVPSHVSKDITTNKNYDLLKNWNIPGIYAIETPSISKETIYKVQNNQKQVIDYDLLGKSVAKHIKIPQKVENSVKISVDKDGVTVHDGNTVKYRNKKYTGIWN